MNGNQVIYEDQARDEMLKMIRALQTKLLVLGEDMSTEIEILNQMRDRIDR